MDGTWGSDSHDIDATMLELAGRSNRSTYLMLVNGSLHFYVIALCHAFSVNSRQTVESGGLMNTLKIVLRLMTFNLSINRRHLYITKMICRSE